MSIPTQATLLRRTTVAAAAVACLFAVADAGAASIKLNNGNNNECTYSGMTIDPAGNVTVQCTATQQPQPNEGGKFSLSTGGGTVAPSSNNVFSIVRSGGTTGAVRVGFGTSGDGCVSGGSSADFGDGDGANKTFTMTVGNAGTTCTVTLNSITPISSNVGNNLGLGTPSSLTYTVQAGTTPTNPTNPTPTPGVNCPTGFTPPADMLTATLGGAGNILKQMQSSGQVVSIPLPALSWVTGQIGLSESPTTYSPQPVTIEVSINKCPGLIEPFSNGNYCNLTSTNGNYNAITWFAKSYSVVTSAESLISRGLPYCWAGDAGVQYYANMRWTYNSCPYGQRYCGFQVQYNQGPY